MRNIFCIMRTADWFGVLAVFTIVFFSTASFAEGRGFLGMQVQGNSVRIAAALSLPTTEGVLVRDVSVYGPASRAGISRGDIIIKVHGTSIDTFERLLQVSGTLKPDDEVVFEVLRLGKKLAFNMKLTQWPDGWTVDASSFAAQPDIGITFAALTPKMRKHLNVRWGTIGIAVSVSSDGFAGLTSLRRGDVVTLINQAPVWDPKQFLDAYSDAKKAGRDSMLLLVERSDGLKYVIQPIVYPDTGQQDPGFKLPGMQQGG